jgi:mannose-6-phosphate isomerase-like protein (cupin superfamily)
VTIRIPKVPLFGKNIKVWGWTQTVALSDTLHVAYASINEGGYSSKHYHENNYNRFYVISGKLRIDIYRNNKEEFVDLVAGETVDVEPAVWHRMTALEPVRVIEIYWPTNDQPINPEDIVREDNGGLKPPVDYIGPIVKNDEWYKAKAKMQAEVLRETEDNYRIFYDDSAMNSEGLPK